MSEGTSGGDSSLSWFSDILGKYRSAAEFINTHKGIIGKFLPDTGWAKSLVGNLMGEAIDAATVAAYNRNTKISKEFENNLKDMFAANADGSAPKVQITEAVDNLKKDGKYTFQVRGYASSPFLRLKR